MSEELFSLPPSEPPPLELARRELEKLLAEQANAEQSGDPALMENTTYWRGLCRAIARQREIVAKLEKEAMR